MEEVKTYLNKDLFQDKDTLTESVSNDFVGSDFVDQLEWGMILVQDKFKQIRLAEYDKQITAKQFDRAFLLNGELNEDMKIAKMMTDLQATPEMFPNLSIKMFYVGETIALWKVRELEGKDKRNLVIGRKHAYEFTSAIYKKDTEAFYGKREGFAYNPTFFREKESHTIEDIPRPFSLTPGYFVDPNSIKNFDPEDIFDINKRVLMAYQFAFSIFYEWSIYIRDKDSIGFVIPIDPFILSEIYKTSLLKFEDKKRMLHFVRDHYRRKQAVPTADYSVYVQRYLRGEHKFDYRGFYAEIIPPKYELNRVKTRKKFVNVLTEE